MAPASRHDIDSSVIDLAILSHHHHDHRERLDLAAVQTDDRDISPTLPPSTQQSLLRRLPASRLVLQSLPLLTAIALLVLLLASASSLNQTLRYDSCTPSGEFVLPGTASIWDSKRFFEITMPFTASSSGECPRLSRAYPLSSACESGYSFTQVKAIDIAWDVLVGRGLQALFVLVAYMVFSRMIASLMENGEVGYDMFAAVAFNAGSLISIVTLARHILGMTPIPRTRRAILAYLGMMLATVYLICLPSLVSAMTGYVPHYRPYFRAGPGDYLNASVIECGGGLFPVWGQISMNLPHDFTSGNRPTPDKYQIIDDRNPYFWDNISGQGSSWIECK